jgi:translation initiation factor 1 (eIF-1/SUI1)
VVWGVQERIDAACDYEREDSAREKDDYAISGLETFSVDVDEFAEVLRKLCAGSASGELSDSCIWELS